MAYDASEMRSYWNSRYASGSLSGDGSYGRQLENKLAMLDSLEFKSILDVGCGDMNVAKHIIFSHKLDFEDYHGWDISENIIERNRRFYPRADFHVIQPGEFPSGTADMTLCLDVLMHINSPDERSVFLENLKNLWKGKYLALTAYEYDEELPSQHITVWKFDPAYFGKPIRSGIVEEDGSMMMYVYEH